jgi:hypothetical protein
MIRYFLNKSRGPGSIPGATRFSEKQWVWKGVPSASWVQLKGYLEEKVAAPVQKAENTSVEIRHAGHVEPSIRKSWLSLGRYSSLAESDHGVFLTYALR